MISRAALTRAARSGLAAVVIVIAWFAFTPAVPAGIERIWDKFQHVAAFVALTALLDLALPERGPGFKIALALAYGLLIEAVQSLLPWRDASLRDLGADLIGIGTHFLILRPLASGLWRNRS